METPPYAQFFNNRLRMIEISNILPVIVTSNQEAAERSRTRMEIGYKKTLIRSMLVMVLGLAFYLASALIAEYWGGAGVHISLDFVPFGYFIFLFGSYLMGTSAAMLQVVINPYIAA